MKYWKLAFFSLICISVCQTPLAQVMGNSNYAELHADRTHKFRTFSAYDHPGSTPLLTETDILISATGMYNVLPDRYVATFNIIQSASTAELTDQMMNTRIDKFKQSLRGLGIKDQDIYVDMMSFVPKYIYQSERKIFSKTLNEVPSGFDLQKNISIQYDDPVLINKLVSLAAESEIYDLVKVDGFIRNVQPYKDTLKTACLAEINRKIKSYEKLGIRLDTMRKTAAETFDQFLPQNRYSAYSAFARSASPDQKSNPAIIETEKRQSHYYDALEASTFDFVFNPVILEPPIQIIYGLTMRFTFIKSTKMEAGQYLLTPVSDIKDKSH